MPTKLPPVAAVIKSAQRPEQRKLFTHCKVCGQMYNKDMPDQVTHHFTADHRPWTPRASA